MSQESSAAPGLAIAAPAPSATEAVVSWANTRQTIDGFGGSLNNFDWGAPNTVAMTDPEAKALFDPIDGAGLSIVRAGMSPEADLGWINATDLTKAAAWGARIVLCPWTPPDSLKTNGSELGTSDGHLITADGGTAANTWATKFVDAIALVLSTCGVNVFAVIAQNEPDFPAPYEGCLYTPSESVSFAKVLGPKLAALSPAPLLIIGSFSDWGNLQATVTAVEADATAKGYVARYATNQYYGTPAYPSGTTKQLWETEVSIIGGSFDPGIDNAIYWAKKTHVALVDGKVSVWCSWWIKNPYDPADGAGDGDAQALVSRLGTKAKRLWGLAQWAKFVRPGWVALSVAGGPANTYITAFRHPSSGAWAVVIVNDSGSSQSFGLSLNGATPGSVTPYRTSSTEDAQALSALTPSGVRVAVTVAANSITTYTGNAS